MADSFQLLLAQASSTSPSPGIVGLMIAGLVLLVLVVPFLLGNWVAKQLRMPDHSRRIGLVLLAVIASVVIITPKPKYLGVGWPPKWGTDLAGGVILVFEVDLEQSRAAGGQSGNSDDGTLNMGALIEALKNRLNPTGTKEIVIRKFGDRQVEIVIPEVDPLEVAEIKKQIKQAGNLEFRIIANQKDHEQLIALAKEKAIDPDPNRRKSTIIEDAEGKRIIGRWVTIGRDDKGEKRLKFDRAAQFTIRNAANGEVIAKEKIGSTDIETYMSREGINDLQILMDTSDKHNVTGADLGVVSRDHDEQGRNQVAFTLKSFASRRMQLLTGANQPDGNHRRQLGIILDNTLLSGPDIQSTISEQGRITGNFTREEVDFLVSILKAGRLPAVLHKEPVSENNIDPLLGSDMILKGELSILGALFTVVLFILVYYRASGLIANFCLALNIALIVAVMILIKAPFTLPGLAGLVLTVGMAVDSNVLISERMREELAKGTSLRLVIRNGFDRAFATIVDSNLTTLITSVTLYVIGTDTVRGFAVTLTLGILLSMFTAVFCGRVIFEIGERQRWLKSLSMMRFFERTKIDFMKLSPISYSVSLVIILIGLVATVVRGPGMLDIDFLGGTSVQPVLAAKVNSDELRRKLDGYFSAENVQYSLTRVQVASDANMAVYRIDTSIRKKSELEEVLTKALVDDSGKSLIATYSMNYTPPRPIELEIGHRPEPASIEAPGTNKAKSPPTPERTKTPPPSSANPVGADSDSSPQGEPKKSDCGQEPANEESVPDETVKTPSDSTTANNDTVDSAPGNAQAEKQPDAQATDNSSTNSDGPTDPLKTSNRTKRLSESILTFAHAINATTLQGRIEDITLALNLPKPEMNLINESQTDRPNPSHLEWKLQLNASVADTERILAELKAKLEHTFVFLSSSEIGSQVAGDTQARAIYALLASLVGITMYVWFRFHSAAWGVAAVLALVHDVLVLLGAIAVSKWLAPVLGFAGMEEFKINLVVVAAFLTLVGYSINDTIVIFDRLREEKGRSQLLSRQMVNDGINLTLSRTTLTSLTTLLVVVVLYFFGGQSIHGFAFSLCIGVVFGTYSSIFIAAPLLIHLGPLFDKSVQNPGQMAKKVTVRDT